MKTYFYYSVLVSSIAFLSACQPVVHDDFVEIQPNETAFLIALDGNTQRNQEKMNSIEFLNANKVQAKRVRVPHQIVDACPNSVQHCYIDQPAAKLVRISRTPVSREWTSQNNTGTSTRNQAFHVESNESIDFLIGATITTHVSEEDTARFLYYYAGNQLEEVVDNNIRSYIGSILAHEFGGASLDYGRSHKNEVFAAALDSASKHFKERGITIDNFGYSEGMTYSDPRIQDAINKKFEADMLKSTAEAQVEAAAKFAQAKESVIAMQELEFHKKLVDAQVGMAAKWDGHAPQVVTSDSLFGQMFAAQKLNH